MMFAAAENSKDHVTMYSRKESKDHCLETRKGGFSNKGSADPIPLLQQVSSGMS